MVSLGDLKYVSPATLRGWLTKGPPGGRNLAVIDVRGGDFAGGHIKGCWRYPSGDFSARLGELQQKAIEKNVGDLVFHCALSQQRGPSSALKFLRGIDQASEENRVILKNIRVWVLEGGFTKWQEAYGEDTDVTEDYDKEIWQWP